MYTNRVFYWTVWAQLPLKSSLLDKPALEQYLRHMEMWIPAVAVTIEGSEAIGNPARIQ